ncbi:MAG: glutathione-disulfide reductase [Paracoccaceae bacterium]
MADFDFDLFVIGGGSGGVRAGRVAAQNGQKVALAEEDRYGGTCVIRGCVPKKLMVFASGFPAMIEEARAYGWQASQSGFHWPEFKSRLHAELDRLEGIYRNILKNNNVHSFDARATVTGPHGIKLSTGEEFTARHILLAMGGTPVKPDLPGAELGMTSNDIFHMDALPQSMLIIGGGYIACEFAGVMNGLGTKVTQYYRGAQVLRGFDDEARGLVAEEMIQNGIDLHLGTDILSLEKDGGGIRVKATNGTEQVFETVLFATGRRPNTDDMGLEQAGVRLGRGGEVLVDAYSKTDVDSIWAVGDATNRVNLTPVAIREGMAFVETAFKGNPTKPDHDLIPTAIFTQPEMGTVGLSEEEAREKGPIEVYATSFKPMQTAFAGKPARVLMKLIVCADTRRVLGCHIVAPQAGEMIQLAGIAVKMGATKEQFDATCAVHPTMAEELVTMSTVTRHYD